ncbi:hypothetical protein [Variovorax ginsengisoli]|uniref:Uncharacterized protein n=1 Tax=Variovorax ginsengisoli TaxID=363844 RepID=A0ABT8SA69_9BURK|nr:hypothetical protein [Variovorax ginsengisoli]MDN8616518.1 hypothetical protein [Variovorax ginsengisoli]MDO1535688.1 hypothetical protein [Variovorax ginsengisoli]
MIDIPVIGLFVAAIVSGFIGAFVGAAFVIRSLATGRIAARAVELPRRVVALDSLKVMVAFKEEAGRIVMETSKEIRTKELEAIVIESWLDDNDLVAQFKGRDFKVPAPTSSPWKETR